VPEKQLAELAVQGGEADRLPGQLAGILCGQTGVPGSEMPTVVMPNSSS
jgi:hypothetical protein